MIVAACSLLCLACGEKQPPVTPPGPVVIHVSSVTLNRETMTLTVGDEAELRVTISPGSATDKTVEWKSDDENVATVDANGMVTGVAYGRTTVTVTALDGGHDDKCTVIVEHPAFGTASFRSDKTWTVGDLVWSDAVTGSRCKTGSFDSGYIIDSNDNEFKADCHTNGEYGDLFSWGAVNLNGDNLCPDEWRVPTTEDFGELDKAITGRDEPQSGGIYAEAYIEQWGAGYGGLVYDNNPPDVQDNNYAYQYQGQVGYYWSVSEANETQSFYLNINSDGRVYPQNRSVKLNGFTVRCVREK
jgi:uncharacterized protein (TIGR02145 family)